MPLMSELFTTEVNLMTNWPLELALTVNCWIIIVAYAGTSAITQKEAIEKRPQEMPGCIVTV
jgi:hypothetical protein